MARTAQRKHCTHVKKNGKRCEAWAIHGGTVCVSHGGQLPRVKAKAKQRVQTQRAQKALFVLGRPRVVDPHAGLLEEVHRTAGHVAALELIVSELRQEALVGGQTRRVTSPDGEETVTIQTALNVWLRLYQAERKHYLDACREAIRCGVEQARLELQEREATMIADVFRRVFADPELGLTAQQRRTALVGAGQHLRLLAGGAQGA